MNVDLLRTIVAVAEQGSLSAAARSRQISQPAVTKQLQRLEAELGLSLLVRGPKRHAEFTPAGQRFLAFARETLDRYEALERELAALKTVGQGTLILAASTIPGEYLLPQLLAAFRERYPQIEVRTTIADSTAVAARVLAGEADAGLVGSAVSLPGLRLERVTGDEVVLAVPPDHPFATRQSVAFDELRGQRLILREEGSGTRQSVEAALAAAGLSLAGQDAALVLGSTQAVLQAVEARLGIGFVSARASRQAQADGHLACVALSGIDLHRSIYLAYLPERAGDALLAHFLEFVRQQL